MNASTKTYSVHLLNNSPLIFKLMAPAAYYEIEIMHVSSGGPSQTKYLGMYT